MSEPSTDNQVKKPAQKSAPKNPRAKALQAALSQSDPRRQEQRSRRLVTVLALGLSGLLTLLLARMLWLQAHPSEQILELNEQSTIRRSLVAYRGALTDRHGRVLAASQLRYRLFVDPKMVQSEAATLLEKKWPNRVALQKNGLKDAPPDFKALVPPELQLAIEQKNTRDIGTLLEELIRKESVRMTREALADLPRQLGLLLGHDRAAQAGMAKRLAGKEDASYVVLDNLLEPKQVDLFKAAKAATHTKPKKKGGKEPGAGEDETPVAPAPDFLAFKGLSLESCSLRNYPLGSTAGQLIGFTGKEEVLPDGRRQERGLEGLERLWNARLQSTPGVAKCVVDKHRQIVWVSADDYQLPKDGDNVQLALDARIQEVAEKQLEITCTKSGCENGIMVVMQPHTGEILAMATWPPFDPSKAGSYGNDERTKLVRNRAVADAFEPGSIFKPMVWASLVDDGIMRPEDKVDTTTDGAWRMPSGRLLHDAHPGHGHGMTTWEGVLAMSSNIGMAKGALKAGHDTKSNREWMYQTLKKWGFGATTGSGLMGEENGILNPVKKWDNYTMGSLPMGQSITVTPLQIMRAYCAIANGGMLLKPSIEVVDGRKTGKLEATRVISEQAAATTRQAMRKVMLKEPYDGTGKNANSKYYDLFGKTGTAQYQIEGRKGYSEFYTSSFVGGAPLDKPRLVVGCFLRKTKKGRHYGGTVAAPFVKNTLEASLIYLGVPTNPGTDPSKMYQEWDAENKKRAAEAGVEYDQGTD